MRFITDQSDDYPEWLARVATYERSVEYPIGNDWFSIDHGTDYLAFFMYLGTPHYMIAVEGDDLVGVGCGVLRHIEGKDCWYLCDLKVTPPYQGKAITHRLYRECVRLWSDRCLDAYAISMNKGDGSNPVLKLLQRLPGFSLSPRGVLNIYQVSAAQLPMVIDALKREDSICTGWISHEGRKDILLRSTGKKMPLYHLQYGPCADVSTARWDVDANGTYMFTTWDDAPMAELLREKGVCPSATATVASHRMTKGELGFILTSEI